MVTFDLRRMFCPPQLIVFARLGKGFCSSVTTGSKTSSWSVVAVGFLNRQNQSGSDEGLITAGSRISRDKVFLENQIWDEKNRVIFLNTLRRQWAVT